MTARLLPCGEQAVLVELDDLAAVLALDAAVVALVTGGAPPWGEVVDVVPAARTLLLTVGRPGSLPRLVAALAPLLEAAASAPPVTPDDAPTVEVAVRYDGPDLAEVAARTGLTELEVAAAHAGTPWRVAFVGFAPGFAYLVGGDPRLVVPRRPEPRTVVPAGSVGLAGHFSGVYPRASPGGWQLIGRTGAALWDADRQPPALLQPGWRVRFVARGS